MRLLISIIDVIGIIYSTDCIDNFDIVNYDKSLENGKVHET